MPSEYGSSDVGEHYTEVYNAHFSEPLSDCDPEAESGVEVACPAIACPVVEEIRWDEWEDRVGQDRRTRPLSKASRAATVMYRGNVKEVAKHMEKYLTPCMPTIYSDKVKHREKLIDRAMPFNLKVARPVGRQEMTESPIAQAAMQKEWDALLGQKVWNLMVVREKSDVVHEARVQQKTVQFGRVHGICVEQNFELPQCHASRKFKGRVVFLGNQVKNQDFEQATFVDFRKLTSNHRKCSVV